MSDLFVILVSTSLCGDVIFGLILSIKFLLPNKYSDYIYILMKIIGIFFLLPVFAISKHVINDSSTYYRVNYQSEDFNYIQQIDGFKKLDLLSDGPYISIVGIIILIWFVVFVLFYMVGSIQGMLLINKIMKRTTDCEVNQKSLLDELKGQLKIKKDIKLYTSDIVQTPFLTGIFYPKIILPNVSLTDEDWKLLMKHELTHYKNHDLLFKNLIELIQKIHWFNPFIYFYAKVFFESSELVCDQSTIKSATAKQRTKYANMLIQLAAETPSNKAIASFSNSDYKVLERRIHNIMKKPSSKKKYVVALTTICLLLSCPIVSYASTWGTMYLQDKLVTNIEEKNSIEESSSTLFVEMNDYSPASSDYVYAGDIGLRGINQVDYVLSATGEAHYQTINLNSGSTVRISLSSENSSDKYRVGIINGSGTKRYVSSNKGMVSKEFSITEAGEYTIYFQGKNTNGQSIHLMGTININY